VGLEINPTNHAEVFALLIIIAYPRRQGLRFPYSILIWKAGAFLPTRQSERRFAEQSHRPSPAEAYSYILAFYSFNFQL